MLFFMKYNMSCLVGLILTGLIAGSFANLTGIWRNQLNSTLTVSQRGRGLLVGDYRSGVGVPPAVSYAVFGMYDEGTNLIYWRVLWRNNVSNFNSSTVWIGQYFPAEGNGDIIVTNWLLTSQVKSSRDSWGSTRVGSDTFVREN